jgi:hypothetical protein
MSRLTAAQRGYDHDFISGTQRTVEPPCHVSIDEKADVPADAPLFIDDAMAHPRETRIERIQQTFEGFAFGFDLLLPAGVRKQRTRNKNADHAAVTE